MNSSFILSSLQRWMRRISITAVAMIVVIGLSFSSAPRVQAGGPYDGYGFSWDCGSCTTGHGGMYWYSGDCGNCVNGQWSPSHSMDTGGSPVTSIAVTGTSLNDGGEINISGTLVYHQDNGGRDNCWIQGHNYQGPGAIGTTITVSMHVVDSCGGGGGGNVSFVAYRIGPPAWPSSSSLAAPTAACATLKQEQSLGLPIVTLTWSGASAAARYDIYQNGTYAGTTTTTSFTLVDQSTTSYSYFIRAWNTTNYTDSNPVSLTTPDCGHPAVRATISPPSATLPIGGSAGFTLSATVDGVSVLP